MHYARRAVVFVFALLVVWRGMAAAYIGMPDPRFGQGGIATSNILEEAGIGGGFTAIVAADGKLVVAGQGDSDFELVRYDANGSIDSSFGDSGHVRTSFGGNDAAFGLLEQPDGRLVAAGWSGGQVALARYNSDGGLDTSFGIAGKVTTAVSTSADGQAVLRQPDGKLVVAGTCCTGSVCGFLLVRYNSDGSLDTSFAGGDGHVETALGDGNIGGYSVALQADGKLLVAGRAGSFPDFDNAIARYNADGSPDTSFGVSGVITPISGADGVVTDLVVQSDGKIVAAGALCNPGCELALTRLNADGSIDLTFDGDGSTTVSLATGVYASSLVLQSDGKLLAAGSVFDGVGTDFLLVRFNADGSLDTTYDGDGIITTAVGSGDSSAHAVALHTDGKAIAAGSVSSYGIGLARYETDGSLDGTFGTGGIVTTGIGLSSDTVKSILIQPDGALVAAGATFNYFTSDGDFALARFDSAGGLDPTFDGDGIVTTDVDQYDEARAIALQSDGKLVAAGMASTGFAVVRYHSDGSLDGAFGVGGKVIVSFGGYNEGANGVVIQTDGKIVVAGTTATIANDIALARFNSDGSLDAGFGTGGQVVTDLGSNESAATIVLQADGKLVVAGGAFSFATQTDFALLRYNTDGSLDTSFDGDGVVTTDFAGLNDEIRALLLQSDGKLVAGGYRTFVTSPSGTLARYNADGSLDTSFGVGGTSSGFNPRQLAFDADGRLLVAAGLSVARYTPDGTLDQSFGAHGSGSVGVGPLDEATAIAVDAAGDVVVGGYAADGDSDFAVARLITGCPATPPTCRSAQKNKLLIKNQFSSTRSVMLWKWILGDSTSQPAFEDPSGDAIYSLCLFANSKLQSGMTVAPQASQWIRLGASQDKGLLYLDPDAAVEGIKKVLLRTSDTGRSRIILKGKGLELPEHPLPFALPVDIQLHNSQSGVCWGSTFTAADRNDETNFEAHP